jgi:anti-sigma factor RsiW
MSGEDSIPDWQLERFVLGELPGSETRAVREALTRDPRIGERIAALERSNAEIRDQRPVATAAAAILDRLSGEASGPVRLRPSFPAWAAVGAVVCVAAVTARFFMSQPGDGKPDVTRAKGGSASRLMLYRKAPAAPAEPLPSGSRARARDVVQIVYQLGAERYGAIVSIDGRGNVTAHLPKAGEQAVALNAGAPVPLPEAYELDDAPAFERFYLVTATEPFAVEVVIAALRRPGDAATGRLDLPGEFDQLSFVLEKEAAR